MPHPVPDNVDTLAGCPLIQPFSNIYSHEYLMSHSTRFTIAAHIMTLLAHAGPGQVMTSEYIAGSANTNPVVIRRLLRLLAQARLVESTPGATGGSRLARPAAEITLQRLYEAVEPDTLFALHRKAPNPACPVGRNIHAALRPAFDRAQSALLHSLGTTTVADLARSTSRGARARS